MSLTFSTIQNELFTECLLQTLKFSTPKTQRHVLKGTSIIGPTCDTGDHYAMVATFKMIGVAEDVAFCRGKSKFEYHEIPGIIESNAARFGIDLPWMLDLFFDIAVWDDEGKSLVENDLGEFFSVPAGLQRLFELLVECDFANSELDRFAWSEKSAISLFPHGSAEVRSGKILLAYRRQISNLIEHMPSNIEDDIRKTEGNGFSDKIDAAARWILLHFYNGGWNSAPVTPHTEQWNEHSYHYEALALIAEIVAAHFRGQKTLLSSY